MAQLSALSEMRAFKTILLTVGVTLVSIEFCWHVWTWRHYAEGRAILKHFKVEYMHTNDYSSIGIYDVKTGQPIWVRWDFGHGGDSVMESYYFQGHDVFDITFGSNRPARYGVYFLGPGRSATWWLDRLGNGAFTERIFYDTNGAYSKHEVWYDNKWQLVDKRDRTNGLVFNGIWHSFARTGTNETWKLEGVSTNQF
jgi:hypothetical protein